MEYVVSAWDKDGNLVATVNDKADLVQAMIIVGNMYQTYPQPVEIKICPKEWLE